MSRAGRAHGQCDHPAVEHAITRSVTGDNPKRSSVQIRDPRVDPRTGPPRRRDRAVARNRPANLPSGVSAASSRALAATTNCPNGDQLASRYGPSRRLEPSWRTTHAPAAESTSRRPAAGSRTSAGSDGSMRAGAIASRSSSSTARPGGETAAATMAATIATAIAGLRNGRRFGVGSRSAYAARTTAHARRSAPASSGRGRRREREPKLFVVHRSRRSPSASRPRRRRELTVPRGSSSSLAISPGVYSSR